MAAVLALLTLPSCCAHLGAGSPASCDADAGCINADAGGCPQEVLQLHILILSRGCSSEQSKLNRLSHNGSCNSQQYATHVCSLVKVVIGTGSAPAVHRSAMQLLKHTSHVDVSPMHPGRWSSDAMALHCDAEQRLTISGC